MPQYVMKVVLMGDGAVGKTTVRDKYTKGLVHGSVYKMTVGADFATRTATIDDDEFKFQIWDLAGQLRFQSVQSIYYNEAKGGLLLFDVTRVETFQNLNYWLQEFWKNNGHGIVPVVVIGNKIDLREAYPDAVSEEEGKKYCEQLSKQTIQRGFETQYLETCALTGQNVSESFEIIAKTFLESLEKNS